MKVKSFKSVIIQPLIAGLLCFVVGGGLLIYYIAYAKDSSIASYVITSLILFAGVIFLLSTIYFVIINKLKIDAYNKGSDIVCEYISHNTNVSAAKVNYYYIEYKFVLDGKEVIKKSKSEFVWSEVLAFKAMKTFNAKFYKERVVLNIDLEKYIKENKELIDAQQKLYDDAYRKIDNL